MIRCAGNRLQSNQSCCGAKSGTDASYNGGKYQGIR